MGVRHVLMALLPLILAGCVYTSAAPPPRQTTVIVPPGSTATVVCANGAPAPCQ